MMTTVHMAMAQLKPFNPILGETFQAKINDCLFYLEQCSHHPPIFNFYVNNFLIFYKNKFLIYFRLLEKILRYTVLMNQKSLPVRILLKQYIKEFILLSIKTEQSIVFSFRCLK